MLGYYEQPEENARVLRDGWFYSGDIGRLDELGRLYLVDRKKEMIKYKGFQVPPAELEALLVTHPSVADAAVIGIPDDKWDERPLACVVRKQGSAITPDALRAYLEDKVAKWWLPERWTFIDEIPKTSVGKFDKKVLRTQHAQGKLRIE